MTKFDFLQQTYSNKCNFLSQYIESKYKTHNKYIKHFCSNCSLKVKGYIPGEITIKHYT